MHFVEFSSKFNQVVFFFHKQIRQNRMKKIRRNCYLNVKIMQRFLRFPLLNIRMLSSMPEEAMNIINAMRVKRCRVIFPVLKIYSSKKNILTPSMQIKSYEFHFSPFRLFFDIKNIIVYFLPFQNRIEIENRTFYNWKTALLPTFSGNRINCERNGLSSDIVFEKYHFNSMINSISDHFLLINENILSLNLVEILFDSNIITAKTVQILYNETGRCKDKWRFHGHSRRFISAENSNPNPHIPVISSTFVTYVLSRFLNHS